MNVYKFSSIYLFTGILTATIFYSQTWKTSLHDTSTQLFITSLTTTPTDTVPPKSKKDSARTNAPVHADSLRKNPADSLLQNANDTTPQIKTDSFS